MEDKDKNIFTEEEIWEFYQLVNTGNIYDWLVDSFAPSLFGM